MTSVKGQGRAEPAHATMLLGLLLDDARAELMTHEWDGLRVSHFRVATMVPSEGINVTDLARRAVMTKQGCGQLIARLVETGHLTSTPDPADGRVRWVRRTPRGDAMLAEVARVLAGLEARWAGAVGAERYRTFRGVLEQLASTP